MSLSLALTINAALSLLLLACLACLLSLPHRLTPHLSSVVLAEHERAAVTDISPPSREQGAGGQAAPVMDAAA